MSNLTLAICLYNAERYIEETLRSVLAQTMQDFHLLIVDDCSTDRSVEIVNDFFKAHSRQYELLSFAENRGIAYARNFAIHHSQTKYFLFIDSDDLLVDSLVEKEYKKISTDIDLMGVSCWSEFINENGYKISGGTYLGAKTKSDFIKKATNAKLVFLPIHTMFDRQLAVESGGFVTSGFFDNKPRLQDYCEDLDLWTRMSDFYKDGKAIITLPEVLYFYRKADTLSSNHFNMIIKMRYTKANLLRRRRGEKELTFVEFYNGLSKKELSRLRREAKSADALRNGVFYLKRKYIFKAIGLLLVSIWYNPSYIIDKLKYNLRIKK